MTEASERHEQEVPLKAVPLSLFYPQFTQVVVPGGADADSAWIGEIQPFTSDTAARAFLHDIEAGKSIWVSGGRVQERGPSGIHWADPLLLNMTARCKLLILTRRFPAHPRAYLLNPEFPEHYSFTHPHPRFDLTITWEGKKVPGLCVYSAAEFKFDPKEERNRQFLDQVTLYVARHLIWLRTRQLFRGFPPKGQLLRVLLPGDQIGDDRPVLRQPAFGNNKPIFDFWAGYWPGGTALAFDPATHLSRIKPHHECWCGNGKLYGMCHRPEDVAKASA